MNSRTILRLGLLVFFAASGISARAQEMVTIPKSRLEELERKEKELQALQGRFDQARGEQEQLRRAKEAAEARAIEVAAVAAKAEPVIAHDTPPMASLPPLKKGEVVDALDLMNHYRADAAGAEKRYGKQRIRVRGVVTGFEKPLFVSPYIITLQSTERSWKIICSVDPPEEFKSTYPVEHGEMLVGTMVSGARITLARVGQTVEIEAGSRGLKGQTLTLSGGRLVSAN